MRNVAIVFLVVCLFATSCIVTGCDKEPERMDDYLVEFATLLKEGNSYRFRIDNGRLMIPVNEEKVSGPPDQRVIVNYVPLRGDSIRINFVSPIFTGAIEPDGFPEQYINDPLKVQSVWVSGGYLNLIMEIEYHSRPHSMRLFRDLTSPDIHLYLGHSKNDDPPGAPQVMHASFSLANLRTENETSTLPFKLSINTYSGVRVFQLALELP